MNHEELTQLSDEALDKKKKNTQVLVGIFIPLILGLLYFGIRDYQQEKIDTPVTIIAICAIGGLVSLLPGLKNLRAEQERRRSDR